MNSNHNINLKIPDNCTRSSSSLPAQSPACAACKYQRRKCASDCPLAPYFPSVRAKEFTNAHKLFGVSNILKVLKKAPPGARDAAMHSIIFHAEAREADPVCGCYGIVESLLKQIEIHQAELDLVMREVAAFRALAAAQSESRRVPDRAPEHIDVTGVDVNIDSVGQIGESGSYKVGVKLEENRSLMADEKQFYQMRLDDEEAEACSVQYDENIEPAFSAQNIGLKISTHT